ncbi:MAG TPA: fibronectin type III domain-containing protein [Candidatus Acidoferrales bacterium]|nr:fibronectin type III domain-containing protein [Candidatus Acidoferrales bacterium]
MSVLLCHALMLFIQLPVHASQSVALTWNPSAATNVAGYKIYFGTTSHNYSATNTAGLTTNATISGLAEGSTYYFSAASYDSAGNQSTNSTEVSYAVPASLVQGLPPGLHLVTGLKVTANPGVPNSVILSWTASTDAGVAGYQIFSGSAPGNYSMSQNLGLVNSLVFTGLTPGATSYYAIKEYDTAWNESDISAEISWQNPVSSVPAAKLAAPVRVGKQFSFTVSGPTNTPSVVQASTDLVHWVSVQTNTAPFTFVDTNAASFSKRYFRTYYLSP